MRSANCTRTNHRKSLFEKLSARFGLLSCDFETIELVSKLTKLNVQIMEIRNVLGYLRKAFADIDF